MKIAGPGRRRSAARRRGAALTCPAKPARHRTAIGATRAAFHRIETTRSNAPCSTSPRPLRLEGPAPRCRLAPVRCRRQRATVRVSEREGHSAGVLRARRGHLPAPLAGAAEHERYRGSDVDDIDTFDVRACVGAGSLTLMELRATSVASVSHVAERGSAKPSFTRLTPRTRRAVW